MSTVVTGTKETMAAFNKLETALRIKAHNKAMGKVGTAAKKEIQKRIPKVTGALYKSIGKRSKRKGGVTRHVIVGVRVNYGFKVAIPQGEGQPDKIVEKIPNKYAKHVEFGKANKQPAKFIRGAERDILKFTTDEFRNEYIAEIRKHVKN